tara:strand:- start:140 stop:1042 length:903 start_codon:yes stop_codon:yes gene_type:complete
MSNSIFTKDGTAQGVAKQRFIETIAGPDKRVINDPYADKFIIGASLMKLMGHKLNVWLAKKLAPGFHEHIISRTRFIDDLIEKSAKDGVEQYVILGAGYDARAHRLKLPSSLKIFEVDQPEVQSRKISKLPKELSDSKNIIYVTVDFAHQSLTERLLNSGFDKTKSTIFTLEGVTQYITKEAFNLTIKEIALLSQKASSIFFLSYVDELLDKNPKDCFGKGYINPEKKAKLIKNLSAKAGEPWISFYSSEAIESLLSQNGYSIKENVTFEDLNSLYFAPAGRKLPENEIFKLEHFVIAKS